MTEIRQVSINLEPHPLSSFFPRMEREEFQSLVHDISIHGLRLFDVHLINLLIELQEIRECVLIAQLEKEKEEKGHD